MAQLIERTNKVSTRASAKDVEKIWPVVGVQGSFVD
jgi:hypothetical protein